MNRHLTTAGAQLRLLRIFLGLAAAVALPVGLGWAADAPPPKPATTGAPATLQLANGDFVTGELADTPAGRVEWRSPAFARPLTFALEAVESVQFPAPAQPVPVDAEYRFELARGDVLLGRLASSEGDALVIDLPGQRGLHLERAALRRIVRWQADTIFAGLQGLDGWEIGDGAKPWREEGSRLTTTEKGAELRGGLALPPQACFEIELTWNEDANFALALATGPDHKSSAHAFRCEVQGTSLVVLRETADQADIAKVQDLKIGAGHIQLQLLLDQPAGRLLACSADGKTLAEIHLADKTPVLGGMQLVNQGKHLRLERLSISRWDGHTPTVVAEGGRPRVQTLDGAVVYGNLQGYDADKRQFILEGDAGQQRVDAAQVRDVLLAPAETTEKRACAAVQHSGIRISGQLLKIDQRTVWLQVPGIREPMGCRIEDLRLLATGAPRPAIAAPPPTPQPPGRSGCLEAAGTRLRGWLVDGRQAEGGALAWRPVLSETGVPLVADIAGRIVYREPPPVQPVDPSVQNQPQERSAFGRLLGWMSGADGEGRNRPKKTAMLHLRSGDTLSAQVSRIDEQGVTFASDSTEATSIGHEQLQALELLTDAPPVKIYKPKKERLLTLPRVQRDSPPTHLIRSVNGDYLRGRLLAMDDAQLQVEVRLENCNLPRASVARILWLHPEAAQAAAAADGVKPAAPRVQAVTTDAAGIASHRLTFLADELRGATLSGRSELLGKCQTDLQKIDQLLLGAAIEQAASGLVFHQWALKPAPEPRGADESASAGEGLESALVGKPAPEVEMEFTDGQPFRIADYKGKVLVLDFWASWCGPCLQTMPLVDKVAREFADRDVRLVGVNLAEDTARIKQTLERLELKMPVALDRDGRTAEKYGATAIPQTVIIDRTGKVARLYVGGSARFDEQLREALRAVLGEPAGQPAR